MKYLTFTLINIVLGVTICSINFAHAACRHVKHLTTVGMTSVRPSDDVGEIRQRAIADALKNAIEQALGVYIDQKTYIEDFVSIEKNFKALSA